MLGPTDQGHFLKYLTTLGVAIVVASLGLGGYLLQAQSDLLIKREELAKLTPVAREAINHKQQIALQVTTFAPFVLGSIALVGVIMAVIGLTGWRRKQELLDERDTVEVAKLRRELELMQMTDEETRESLAAEAEDLVEDETAEQVRAEGSAPKSNGDVDDEQQPKSESGVADSNPTLDPSEHRVRQKSGAAASAGQRVTQATEELFAKLRLAYPEADIRPNIRSGQFYVDALAVIDKEGLLFAFELKITTPRNFRNRFADAAIALSSTVVSLTSERSSYRVVPVFVVLFHQDDQSRYQDRAAVVKVAREVSAAVRHPPLVLPYEEEAWKSLPASEFRDAILVEYRRGQGLRY